MKFRWMRIVLLLVVVLAPLSRAQAAPVGESCAPPECVNVVDALLRGSRQMWIQAQISLAHATVRFIWWLARLGWRIFRSVVQDDLWRALREGLLRTLSGLMPEVLRDLVFGSRASAGLMYLALLLAGLALTVPMLAGARRLARADQVILWGVILLTLFVSSTMGYDLIGAVEGLRVGMMQRILEAGGADTGRSVVSFITVPMRATVDEAEQGLDEWALPETFEMLYFPEPRTQTVRVLWAESPLFDGAWEVEFETSDSQEERLSLARTAMMIAFLLFVPIYLLLVFVLVFGLLSMAALALIVFLTAALPLGFFEFGKIVLARLLQKYVEIVVLSLGAALFVSLVGRLVDSIAVSEGGLSEMVQGYVVMLPLAVVVSSFVPMAMNALTGSVGAMRASVRAAFLPMSASGAPGATGGLMREAAGAALGAMGVRMAMGASGPAGVVAGAAVGAAGRRAARRTPRGDVFAQTARTPNVGEGTS